MQGIAGMRTRLVSISFCLLIFVAGVGTTGYGQHEREVPHPTDPDYGPQFFEQLQRMFERYKNGDVHHAFQVARPVQCSELIGDNGEWHDVAFFSGSEGNWYQENLDEIKADLAVYIFEGMCKDQQSILKVTTKVPVADTRDVKVNPPVTAHFKTDNKSYTFDLPYLFREKVNGGTFYTFYPKHASDRYVTHITSHWECKAPTEEFATYRFLICHTVLFGHDPVDITHGRDKPTYSFGASTYSILSDGKPAQ
jgi:hypothetical protein